ncbi:MAG: replication initiator protein [Microvirus sp.]|nr:MAG: replication initiator protein [Microvirus sp.]
MCLRGGHPPTATEASQDALGATNASRRQNYASPQRTQASKRQALQQGSCKDPQEKPQHHAWRVAALDEKEATLEGSESHRLPQVVEGQAKSATEAQKVTCYHPIPAYQDLPGTDVRLWPHLGEANMQLPCGNCLGCKTSHATEWARRAEHEASMWEHNCFLTLTYDEQHLSKEATLEPTDLQKFIKRLRTSRDRGNIALRSDRSGSMRYLASGEYGEGTRRPHYHVCLFNCGFADSYTVAKDLKESPTLLNLWKLGGHRLGELTPASANYVAQYTVKKQAGPACNTDGVLIQAPFLRMSLKPAIGTRWIEKNKRDLQHGYLVNNGTKGRIPRQYRKKLAKGSLHDRLLEETIAQRAAIAARGPPAGAEERKQQLENMEKIHIRLNELKKLK